MSCDWGGCGLACHGIIRYYTYKPGEPFLVAHCSNPAHGGNKCRRTKATYGSTKKNRRGQGRPMGFLMQWLESHAMSHTDHLGYKSGTSHDFAPRCRCRASLRTIDRGIFFANKVERSQRRGEPVEPMTLP